MLVERGRFQSIRELGRRLATIKEFAYDLVVVGANQLEVSRAIESKILELGARPIFKNYHGFPESVCISVNEVLIHGIPSKDSFFKPDDLVKIDLGFEYQGLCADSAFSKLLGSSELDRRLIKTAFFSLKAGVSIIKDGVRLDRVEREIGRRIRAAGFYTTSSFSGHGIGLKLHEEPAIFNDNFYPSQAKIRLREGMLLCIEPMLLQTNQGVRTLKDG